MSQTAIDWLVSELPTIDWSDPYYKAKLEEAKAMEKEIIITAFDLGLDDIDYRFDPNRAERYYYETFNTKEK